MQDMEIPVYIDGRQEGTLRVSHEGPVTVMEAGLRDVGRVVRLRLYGDGEGYLGVPAPRDGRLWLRKRFSPLELRRLPACPRYAAESRLPEREEKREETSAPPEDQEQEPAPAAGTPVPESGEKEEPAAAGPRHVLWMGGWPYYF